MGNRMPFKNPPLLLRAAALLALALAVFLGGPREGGAKLQPYYVVQGASLGQISPRILFVLDTSGSMALRASANETRCNWNECEDGAVGKTSRIAGARQALRAVVDATGEKAKFALMTFDQRRPPSRSAGDSISLCDGGFRFFWVDEYSVYFGNYGHGTVNPFGVGGRWNLCEAGNGSNHHSRPYPYLRWDKLGVGANPATQTSKAAGDVPPSPLVDPAAGAYPNLANATRPVQWFGRFMGVRFHADCSDPDINSMRLDSVGDYSTSAICNNDWYYWPYVDGFPGYASFLSHGPDQTVCQKVCHWWGCHQHCNSSSNDHEPMGIAEEDDNVTQAALYSPFYLDLSNTPIPSSNWGPASEAESESLVTAMVSPMIEGGVDADGGTPWTNVIGTVPNNPPQDNSPFSHTTVASYLKFVQTVESTEVCAPTSAVLVTDGDPACHQNGTNCDTLYRRLSALRTELDVPVYVVGFFTNSYVLNRMACAAAGSCTGGCGGNPCGGAPQDNWDTCEDPNNHWNSCAFVASSPDELASAVTQIVNGLVQTDVSSGPGATVNDFGIGANGTPGEGERLQTKVASWTDWPDWKGHVTRGLCTDADIYDLDEDNDTVELAPYCQTPFPEWEPEEIEPTFGPCPQSRDWDAGTCLQLTDWKARRIYSSDGSGNIFRISDASGKATPQFVSALLSQGLISAGNAQAEADAVTAFILGKDWPDGWKLPGLANSAPVVVRRVPKRNDNFAPSVPIRDPHCAGRILSQIDNAQIPSELADFSDEAWTKNLNAPAEHYEYQEALMIGDDLGILHAFQWNSGNELWGYLPPFLLPSAKAQADIGPLTRGQPEQVKDHLYGIAATMNQGWVWDESADQFRHLGVFGLGKGGAEFVALELSHMSPSSPKGPFEILWTSEDPALKPIFDPYTGETWARPALTYTLANDLISDYPKVDLVVGTGYQPGTYDPNSPKGRTLALIDGITGQPIETAILPKINASKVYEDEFGSVVDPAVGSHCISRFWAERQETYILDPAGRLFRWDLGRTAGHEADSGGTWAGSAKPLFEFPACTGTGASCNVSSGNKRDPFVYGPAVTALNRIDSGNTGDYAANMADQFLLAMVSGSPYDDSVDWSKKNSDFHSSIYMLVDDHRTDKAGGLSVPVGAPKAAPGTQAGYMRMALSDITRQRTFTPYPGAAEITEPAAPFSKRARPIGAPKIRISAADLGNGNALGFEDTVEVMEVEFTIFEPGPGECDQRFYDKANDTWYFDEGSVYLITFRLTVDDAQGFNFVSGAGGAATFDNFTDNGLTLVGGQAKQITDGACADGVCGPVPGDKIQPSCDNNTPGTGSGAALSLPLRTSELVGFTPVE